MKLLGEKKNGVNAIGSVNYHHEKGQNDRGELREEMSMREFQFMRKVGFSFGVGVPLNRAKTETQLQLNTHL